MCLKALFISIAETFYFKDTNLIDPIDDIFDENVDGNEKALYVKRKHVNTVPLNIEQLQVARDKRNKVLSQRKSLKEFTFFVVFIVVLCKIIYHDRNNLTFTYKECLGKLLDIDDSFNSVRNV